MKRTFWRRNDPWKFQKAYSMPTGTHGNDKQTLKDKSKTSLGG